MRRVMVMLVLAGMLILTACGTKLNDAASTAQMVNSQTEAVDGPAAENNLIKSVGAEAVDSLKEDEMPSTEAERSEKIMSRKMKLIIGDTTLTATLTDNSSAQALVEKLKEGDITLTLHDYASFEKVGDLGFSLPRNDIQITTKAGDLILYQGNQFVQYYDTNSWSLTKLGRIDNMSEKELKSLLGSGDVTITLSME